MRAPREHGPVHFVARLRSDGSWRPVLLAAHSDVVPVERARWSVDPFGGVIRDGHVLGRCAMDYKGGLAVSATAVMMLAEKGTAGARRDSTVGGRRGGRPAGHALAGREVLEGSTAGAR